MEAGGNPKNILKIWDQYDDASLGFVNYGQWLPCDTCSPGSFTETGAIALVDNTGTEVLNYQLGADIYVKLIDIDRNLDSLSIDTVSVLLQSQTETSGELVNLYETNNLSGVFMGSIVTQVATPISGDGLLQVTKGDKLTVVYNDPSDDFGNPDTLTNQAYYDVTLLSGEINSDSTFTIAGARI